MVMQPLDVDVLARQVIREFGGRVRGDGPGREAMARRYMELVSRERQPAIVMLLVIDKIVRVDAADQASATAGRLRSPGRQPAAQPPQESLPSRDAAPVAPESELRHKSETPGPAEIPALGKALAEAGPDLLPAPAPPRAFCQPAGHSDPLSGHTTTDDQHRCAAEGQDSPQANVAPAAIPVAPAGSSAEVAVPERRPVATSRFGDIGELRRMYPGLLSTAQTASGKKQRAFRNADDVEFRADLMAGQKDAYASMAGRTLREAGERATAQAEKSAAFAREEKKERALAADMRALGVAVEADLPPEILGRHYARSVAA